jgi:LacI family transcriptional regulator, galactose operon repressor
MSDHSRRETKAATIYDVAKRARVSIKTVSMVINNLPQVSTATRSRVLAAIEDLSYRPNLLARGLASQRSFMIGLFCDGHAAGSNYIAQIQMATLTMCQNEGYHLVVECLRPKNPNIVAQVNSLMAQSKLAGVILTPPLSDLPKLIEALKGIQTPIARYSPQGGGSDFIDVDIDNVRAAYEMTAYLIGLGHRRIGFVQGRPDHADASARFEGYRRALADAAIAFAEELCAPGDYSYRAGMLAGDKLLALPNRPTAIFAGNDDMAGGVMAASLRFNLRIPDDLSVAGFDDTLFAHAMWPRLTTCRQPIPEMTEAVVSALIHPSEARAGTMRFPHKIIVRGSTAAPERI